MGEGGKRPGGRPRQDEVPARPGPGKRYRPVTITHLEMLRVYLKTRSYGETAKQFGIRKQTMHTKLLIVIKKVLADPVWDWVAGAPVNYVMLEYSMELVDYIDEQLISMKAKAREKRMTGKRLRARKSTGPQ